MERKYNEKVQNVRKGRYGANVLCDISVSQNKGTSQEGTMG